MDRERTAKLAELLRQVRSAAADTPVEFIAACGQVLVDIDLAEIERAIPVYAKQMHDMGRPLGRPYIRALGALLAAANCLAEASMLAFQRWRETAADWPRRN